MRTASPITSSVTAKRIVLLFCHGGSYTKECWNPIIRRVQASSLMQRVPHEVRAFDWSYHGEKSKPTPPKISFRNGDKNSPRVEHPLLHWPEWAPTELLEQIHELRKDDDKLNRHTHVVGIGHSMGASSLLRVETSYPGTLDGIVAFEPVYSVGEFTVEEKETVLDMLVNVSLAREGEWDTWEDVLGHMKTARAFKRWDREAVDGFLQHGVEKTEDGKRFRLVISPTAEAAVYCHEFMEFSAEIFDRAQCKMVIEHAERTPFFRPAPARRLAEELPGKFIVSDAVKNTTHSMIVEEPEACASNIVADLEKFPVIQNALQLGGRL